MYHRDHLLAPGPTPVPEEARLAMAESTIHHRGPRFKEVFARARDGLKWLFETERDVLTLTCSGTGAFEAAMANFTSRGDTIVAVGGGKFGQRWGRVGEARDRDVVELEVPWGEPLSPERLADVLEAHPDTAMVTLTASETSTGVLHPVEALTDVVHEHSDALMAVDGITAVGVHRLPMDELELDVLVAGSQKAFGIPPGLGFVAGNERAWEVYETSDSPGFYFDLGREHDRQKGDQTAFTPAIHQVRALDVVLEMMQEEGRETLIERHDVNARATRRAVRALGLDVFSERHSNAVTAVETPEEGQGPDVVQHMREDHGITIAGGQRHLGPRLFRLGHIGFFERSDILNMISALELVLPEVGHEVETGTGIEAAQSVYAET